MAALIKVAVVTLQGIDSFGKALSFTALLTSEQRLRLLLNHRGPLWLGFGKRMEVIPRFQLYSIYIYDHTMWCFSLQIKMPHGLLERSYYRNKLLQQQTKTVQEEEILDCVLFLLLLSVPWNFADGLSTIVTINACKKSTSSKNKNQSKRDLR